METSLVVIALLTLIMMGGRLIKYFGIAAQGRIDANILFSIIGYRLPEFLTLIMPLGFFIGLMLVFGRLIARSELDQDVDPLDLETNPPESAPLIIDFVILIEKMI